MCVWHGVKARNMRGVCHKKRMFSLKGRERENDKKSGRESWGNDKRENRVIKERRRKGVEG